MTNDFSPYLTDDLDESVTTFAISDLGLRAAYELADSFRITKQYGQDSIVEQNPKKFMSLYQDALEEAAEDADKPWKEIIGKIFADYIRDFFDETNQGREQLYAIAGQIREGGANLFSPLFESFLSALQAHEVDLYRKNGSEMNEDLIREKTRDRVADMITGGELYFGPGNEAIDEIILDKTDWREWMTSSYDYIEVPIFLTQKNGEYLDDKTLYRESLLNLDDNDSIEFYQRVLPLLNLSGKDVLGAIKSELLKGDAGAILAIERTDPDQPPKINADDFVRVVFDEVGGYGSPILFGFMHSADLVDIDPREPIRISGNIQFGLHDFINGGGFIDSIDADYIDLPARTLMDYKVGGWYSIDDVYGYQKSKVLISMENTRHLAMPEPVVKSTAQQGPNPF